MTGLFSDSSIQQLIFYTIYGLFFFIVADAAFLRNGSCGCYSCQVEQHPMHGRCVNDGVVREAAFGRRWPVSSSSSLLSESPAFRSFQERLSDDLDPLISSSTDSDSLSDLLSSPQRYAFSLNMTLEEVEYQKEVYQNASLLLQERLENLDNVDKSIMTPSEVGKRKHEMICEHRLRYGRHPFVCSKCWSYLPICVCKLAKTLPEADSSNVVPSWNYPNLQVLVWTHHREWGLTSNTGSILALTLGSHDNIPDSKMSPCCMLMKGLPKHDDVLQEILDASVKNSHPTDDFGPLVVVLWPSSSSQDNAITLSELREELDAEAESSPSSGLDGTRSLSRTASSSARNKRQVVLLAVDGTWRNARRMVAKLPPHVKRLDLDEDALRWNDDMQSDNGSKEEDLVSILAPLRKRGPSGKENDPDTFMGDESLQTEKRQVCTAEAVLAALHELGAIDTETAKHVLSVTQTKVDLVRRYRGKVQINE